MARRASSRRSPTYTVHVPEKRSSPIQGCRCTPAACAKANAHTTATVGASKLARCQKVKSCDNPENRIVAGLTLHAGSKLGLARGRATVLIVEGTNGCALNLRRDQAQDASASFTMVRNLVFTTSALTKTGA